MASFGWKKKAGEKVSKSVVKSFEKDAEEDQDKAITSGEIDWFSLTPTQRPHVLEDAALKSNRLQEEAATLAKVERYWEAMLKLDQAVQLTPNDEKIYEMKAQAFLMLNEVYPAMQAAEKAVLLNPLWWTGHQTLGRAHLGLGEVRLAVKCFSRAIHLKPDDNELWEEDLKWSWELLQRKRQAEEELLKAQQESEATQSCSIKEIEENDAKDNASEISVTFLKAGDRLTGSGHKRKQVEEDSPGVTTQEPSDRVAKRPKNLKEVPTSYVFMRD